MFRGREVTHPERGTMILDRLAEELAELGVVEQRPNQDGRNMTMMLGPSKAVLAGHGRRAAEARRRGRRRTAQPRATGRDGRGAGRRRRRAEPRRRTNGAARPRRPSRGAAEAPSRAAPDG